MKTVFAIVASACLVIFGGCGKEWTRANTTEAESSQDRLQCEQQAARLYPFGISRSELTYQEFATTNCGTAGDPVNCAPGPALDRSTALSLCLESKGYIAVAK